MRHLFRFPWVVRPTRGPGGKRTMSNNAPLIISPEAQHALHSGRPVVALESALVTHGLPSPLNHETARSLESIIRATGSIPATITVLEGKIHVGLSDSELQRLAEIASDGSAVKISRRDLGPAIASKSTGGTTVAATMIISHLAGIRIFGTGGLGGIHRGGETTLDVSADLTELGRTPVAVVCSGVKAILDIGLTLEYLETQGVPVITYGPTRDFPAFYSKSSGYQSPWHLDSPFHAAKLLRANEALGLQCGTLFAVPIPDVHQPAATRIQNAVEQAIQESEENGVSKRGNQVTPWLLARVAELTEGEAVRSNIALLENNAKVAGEIAAAYHQRHVESSEERTTSISSGHLVSTEVCMRLPSEGDSPAQIVVIGSAAVDITAQLRGNDLSTQSTSPGTIHTTLGGVARNMAETTHRLLKGSAQNGDKDTLLVAPLGRDAFGDTLREAVSELGLRTDGLILRSAGSARTAVCNLVLNQSGHLIGGVADMDITEGLLPSEITEVLRSRKPSLVAFDGNVTSSTMTAVLRWCRSTGAAAFFEPTSVAKCVRILDCFTTQELAQPSTVLQFISPNTIELQSLYENGRSRGLFSGWAWWNGLAGLSLEASWRTDVDALCRQLVIPSSPQAGDLAFLVHSGVVQMATHLLPFMRAQFIKMGSRGALFVATLDPEESISAGWRALRSDATRRLAVAHGKQGTTVIQHFSPQPVPMGAVFNTTGAGDTFSGALLAGLHRARQHLSPDNVGALMGKAQQCAMLTLQSERAVSPSI